MVSTDQSQLKLQMPLGFSLWNRSYVRSRRIALAPFMYFARKRMFTRLSKKYAVTELKMGSIDYHFFACEKEDIRDISTLSASTIHKCYQLCGYWFGKNLRALRFRIVVIGQQVAFEDLPRAAEAAFGQECRGCWLYDHNAVLVRICQPREVDSIFGTILHELIHALIGKASNGFPFPCMVEEGMICLAEAAIGRDLTERAAIRGDVLPLRTLLGVDYAQFLNVWREHGDGVFAMAELLCRFLIAWLQCDPDGSGLMARISGLPIRRPSLENAIAKARGASVEELEEAFSFFARVMSLPERYSESSIQWPNRLVGHD